MRSQCYMYNTYICMSSHYIITQWRRSCGGPGVLTPPTFSQCGGPTVQGSPPTFYCHATIARNDTMHATISAYSLVTAYSNRPWLTGCSGCQRLVLVLLPAALCKGHWAVHSKTLRPFSLHVWWLVSSYLALHLHSVSAAAADNAALELRRSMIRRLRQCYSAEWAGSN